jgi:hypothetical protein
MSKTRRRPDDATQNLTDHLAQVGLEDAVAEVRCNHKDHSCVVVTDGVPRRHWSLFLAEVEDWACGWGLRAEVEVP